MQNTYRNFYRHFYMRTGGYIPASPLNQNVYPGDFFQVRNGEMIVLGNVFRKGIIHPADFPIEYGVKLNPANWNFHDGMSKPYSGRGTGNNAIEGFFEYSKQLLAFARKGSFFFRGDQPEAVRIRNWTEQLQQQLIIKMTQTCYSFRELYLVTECVSNASWTLAIAGAANAELEIATETENFGLVDIFGHAAAKTIQSKDMEYYHRENKRKPVFFAAKKLVEQNESTAAFTSDLIRQRENFHEWAGTFFDYEFSHEPAYNTPAYTASQVSVIDMLSANELNPNTALQYFKWADANLDDVEKFFTGYES